METASVEDERKEALTKIQQELEILSTQEHSAEVLHELQQELEVLEKKVEKLTVEIKTYNNAGDVVLGNQDKSTNTYTNSVDLRGATVHSVTIHSPEKKT